MFVVSISEQSRASLATKYHMSPQKAFQKLYWFFQNHLKFEHIFDTSFARDIVLLAAAEEFVDHYKEKRLPLLTSSCPGKYSYSI